MLNISDENGDQVYFRFFETNLLEKDGSIIYEPSKLRMSEDYIRYYRFAFLRTNTHTSHATYVVVLQKVASELHPKVRNHGEGPY